MGLLMDRTALLSNHAIYGGLIGGSVISLLVFEEVRALLCCAPLDTEQKQ